MTTIKILPGSNAFAHLLSIVHGDDERTHTLVLALYDQSGHNNSNLLLPIGRHGRWHESKKMDLTKHYHLWTSFIHLEASGLGVWKSNSPEGRRVAVVSM